MYPLHVKDGDLLGGLITVLAAQIPTCIIHESSAGWSEPEWSPESRRHLAGLISGIRRVPDSFGHTTSPTDLARVSLWIVCASAALSIPGGVPDAHGSVLPSSVGGAKSASKYLTKVMQGLRSNVTDESMLSAIDTLGALLKLWQKTKRDDALSVVRKCKIPWSELLFKGAPTKVIKGKKGKPDQTVLQSPAKPSKSPWLSSAERAALGEYYKDEWSALEGFRDKWVALDASEQHTQFNSRVDLIRKHYEKLHSISSSVHSKLGKRKHWIEVVCKQDNYNPKVKKDESQSFLLSAHFFKKDLSKANFAIKKIFAPSTYLSHVDEDESENWTSLFTFDGDVARYTSADFNMEDHGDTYLLWRIWADLFKPVFRKETSDVAEPQPTQDINIFESLEAEASA